MWGQSVAQWLSTVHGKANDTRLTVVLMPAPDELEKLER